MARKDNRQNQQQNARIFVGISGWTYAPWRGTFYPAGHPVKHELQYASRMLNSIEINGTFYSLQRPSSYQTWYRGTPDDFVFAVKAPRFITHLKQLRDVSVPVSNFFASGVLCLNEKLGPILWQFAPRMKFHPAKFEEFFALLPRSTAAAAELASCHDQKVEGRCWTLAEVDQPLRYAVEIRHESFRSPQWIEMLRRHNIALVVADTAGKWPLLHDVTADFMYLRLHGDTELYVSGYSNEALEHWARLINCWRAGGQPPDALLASPQPPPPAAQRDIYVYFDNDVKVRSPYDAMALRALIIE